MVKNSKGGNKSKRVGRKFLNTPVDRSVRFKQEDGEIYVVISKLFGGDNCGVLCEDGTTRLCVIRKKFRGRGKQEARGHDGQGLQRYIRHINGKEMRPQDRRVHNRDAEGRESTGSQGILGL